MMEYGHAVATKVAGRHDDEFLSAANEATVLAMMKYRDEPKGPDAKGLISTYVKRAVQTLLRGIRRRRETQDEIALDSAVVDDCVLSLSDYIARLPDTQRDLACSVMIEGVSARQIARDRGVSPSTVCDEIKQIRMALRAIYEDDVYARA